MCHIKYLILRMYRIEILWLVVLMLVATSTMLMATQEPVPEPGKLLKKMLYKLLGGKDAGYF